MDVTPAQGGKRHEPSGVYYRFDESCKLYGEIRRGRFAPDALRKLDAERRATGTKHRERKLPTLGTWTKST